MYTPQSLMRARLGMFALMLNAMEGMHIPRREKSTKKIAHTIPKKVWLHKKAARKIQALSRKINR